METVDARNYFRLPSESGRGMEYSNLDYLEEIRCKEAEGGFMEGKYEPLDAGTECTCVLAIR